jgi:hypothetical protein
MRASYWNDTRCGDNVVRVRNFHSAPRVFDQRRCNALIIILPVATIERPCDSGEPEELRERAPP